MTKDIVTQPNPILRKKSQEIKDFRAPEVKKTIQDLKDSLKDCQEGLGLAAPQIGVNLRIFALDWEGEIKIFINPKITHLSKKKSLLTEGCLSVPNKIGKIARANKVIMKYYDEEGKKHKMTAKGLLAQAFQHETDHLDGILYIDKAE
jgi:peptide deformylase